MVRMATCGVAVEDGVRFTAPVSRKPAVVAHRIRSWAWDREAVRTWRIYTG
jgi:hypothetical protein